MGRNKKYSGYKAYQYLTPGLDYKVFTLRKAEREEWKYIIPLSKNEEERFEEIIEKNIVMDLHEHPCLYPDPTTQSPDLAKEGRQFMAYEALSMSGIDCVFDNLLDGRCIINTKHGWDWMSTIHDLGMRLCDIAHQDFVIHAKRVDDIINAFETGRLAWVAVLESASCIENEVDRLDILYGLGVRSIGICYSEANMLGSGLGERRDGGLTDFGYDAVVRMNKLGILIDIAHAGELTCLDTIEASKKPVINSHSGPAAIARGHVHSDEVLKALAEKDGLIAIGGAGYGFSTKKNPIGSIESYMECLEYCINLVGIDHVGCGPDTLYGDHQNHYRAFQERSKIDGLGHYERPGKVVTPRRWPVPEGLRDPGYVKGLENPNEFVNIARWMIKHGYSDAEIAKIIGGNALELIRKVWY
jgi:membrane dipeptidase